MKNSFEIIARACIIKNNKLLLCKLKNANYFFLPGGHVEFGEKSEEALIREMKEEMGVQISNLKSIGAMENIFVQKNKKRHEVNLFFSAKLNSSSIVSLEEHIEFAWWPLKELDKCNLLPEKLKLIIPRLLKGRGCFWS